MHVKSASYCLAVMALLVIGSTIEAQDQGQRQGRGNRGAGQQRMSRSALLRVEVVQDELDISEEQLADLSKLRGQGRGGGERGQRGGERGEGGGERGQRGGERGGERGEGGGERGGDRGERIQAELDQLGEVLEEDQIDRLNEIFVQVSGVAVLQDPLVAKELEISEEQYEEMKELRDEMRSEIREMARDGDREQMREKFTEMNKELGEKLMGVLSDSQQDDLEEMKGKKFDLPEDAMPQRRGRSRGPGGGGN
ncbi:MAG: hypothetical protein P8K79_13240 [Mariniblastus sp.]|nr:hypothetical protein [Mariniblastus sp.]